MTNRAFAASKKFYVVFGLLFFLDARRALLGEATPAAVASFSRYSQAVEARLVQQHRSASGFLVLGGADRGAEERRLLLGEVVIERLTPAAEEGTFGALLHHWRGTAFAPGAKAADFEQLMREFNAYPQHFAPQVVQARVIAQQGDRMQAWMRVRQRHVITVVMDTSYDVTFGQLDVRHGYSLSQSTRIAEIEAAGTQREHALSATEEHGFLWRLNTYWSYEERDGGLYLQIESVSLTRAIPSGLGWAVRPYVESIPRESMEFTLRSACSALRK